MVDIDAADGARRPSGRREALGRTSLTASQVNWTSGRRACRLDAGDGADPPSARRRARLACARSTTRRAELDFDAPQTAVTPGQAVVFYDGEEVLGEGG